MNENTILNMVKYTFDNTFNHVSTGYVTKKGPNNLNLKRNVTTIEY